MTLCCQMIIQFCEYRQQRKITLKRKSYRTENHLSRNESWTENFGRLAMRYTKILGSDTTLGVLKSIERPRLGENQLYYLEKCWERFPLNTGIIQMKHEISLKKLGINSRWELNKDVESYDKRMSKFDWDLIEGGAKSNLRVVLPRKRAQARSQDAWRKASTCDSGQNRTSP